MIKQLFSRFRRGSYLTVSRLHDVVECLSQPYPIVVSGNEMKLVGDFVEGFESERDGLIERDVKANEEEFEVSVDAYCPDLVILDSSEALRFANKWNIEHVGSCLAFDVPRRRLHWYRVYDTRWIRNKQDLIRFVENEYIDMETETSECFRAVFAEVRNFRTWSHRSNENEEVLK